MNGRRSVPASRRLRLRIRRLLDRVLRRARDASSPHPASRPTAAASVARGDAPVSKPGVRRHVAAPMDVDEVLDVRADLNALLGQHPSARRIWPSLALAEKAMDKHGGAGVDHLAFAVLCDAAQLLHRLVDDWCVPGLLILRERVELVLLVSYGHAPTYPAATRSDGVATQVRECSFTEFMEIDREWDDRFRVDTGAA